MKGFIIATLGALLFVAAQPRATGQNASTAKASAPIDITGYWVAFVTEDWRFRMITPRKGDYQPVPMTPEARKVADAWDPAADFGQSMQGVRRGCDHAAGCAVSHYVAGRQYAAGG